MWSGGLERGLGADHILDLGRILLKELRARAPAHPRTPPARSKGEPARRRISVLRALAWAGRYGGVRAVEHAGARGGQRAQSGGTCSTMTPSLAMTTPPNKNPTSLPAMLMSNLANGGVGWCRGCDRKGRPAPEAAGGFAAAKEKYPRKHRPYHRALSMGKIDVTMFNHVQRSTSHRSAAARRKIWP